MGKEENEKKILKGYRYRLYPTKSQQQQLINNIMVVNKFWNWMVWVERNYFKENKHYPFQEEREMDCERYEYKETYIDKNGVEKTKIYLHYPTNLLSKTIPQLKEFPDYQWLKDAPAISLGHKVRHMEDCLKAYWRDVRNGKIEQKRKAYVAKKTKHGGKVNRKKLYFLGFPSFVDKTGLEYGSFAFHQGYKVHGNRIQIPKMQSWLKFKKHRDYKGQEKTVTIERNNLGQWFINFIVHTPEQYPSLKPLNQIQLSNCVGLDMGIKDLCITSDNKVYPNIKAYYMLKGKLRKLQKRRVLKYKDGVTRKPLTLGKRKWNKLTRRIAKLHKKISRMREYYLHQVTTELVNQYDVIVIEKLKVSNMLKNHKLALAISDMGWFGFKKMLEYKTKQQGKHLVEVDQWFPSSQLCSECGYQNKKTKDLKIRQWVCPECGSMHDRDINAAINIRDEGLRILGLEGLIPKKIDKKDKLQEELFDFAGLNPVEV